MSPITRLDYHLVRTAILNIHKFQSRSFPHEPCNPPSLFCTRGFSKQKLILWPNISLFSPLPLTLKAGYTTYSFVPHCRFNPFPYKRRLTYNTENGLHEGRVKFVCLYVRPIPLTPSTSPQLGVESQHKELHRYAL